MNNFLRYIGLELLISTEFKLTFYIDSPLKLGFWDLGGVKGENFNQNKLPLFRNVPGGMLST